VSSSTSAKRASGFDRFMARFLTSPFGSLASGLVLVRYVGRTSGLKRQLPVGCSVCDEGYVIVVGRPEQKTWWRNFLEPQPIQLVRGRSTVAGTGVVVLGSTGRGQRLAADWFAAHRGAARRAGLPGVANGEAATPEALQAAAAPMVFVFVTPAAG
jgi:hypothetical protein